MGIRLLTIAAVPALFAIYYPSCDTPEVFATVPPDEVRLEELWQAPEDIAVRDLLSGSWGLEYALDTEAAFTFVKTKTSGVNPGMTVTDALGRTWSVKQAPHDGRAAEGPIEVVLSRVLDAVGYYQPPVYYVPSFRVTDTFGTQVAAGGRFRLQHRNLKERGTWSWQQNPFVGTRPYQGLLVILLLFNSSDLKNSNNTIYELEAGSGGAERWYVVRDLGTALGQPARVRPTRGDIDAFERLRFVTGVSSGFVLFDYAGWHRELFAARITPADVVWASDLLARLSDAQWHDAFRAGGYDRALASRFIRRIQGKIAEGQSLVARAE